MKFDEMLALQRKPQVRRKPRNEEHALQCACVRWFRAKYPRLKDNLFAVPNGGRRDAITGAKLKEEGVTAGVSDLILLKSNRFYGALCIEMKTPKGRQQDTQKLWQQAVEQGGAKYVVCRSLDDFIREISQYLKDI